MLADNQQMLDFLLDPTVPIVSFLYSLLVGRLATASIIPSETGKRVSINIDGGLGLALVPLTEPINGDHRRQVDLFYGTASLRMYHQIRCGKTYGSRKQLTEVFQG